MQGPFPALAVEPRSPRGLLLQSYLVAALAKDERGDQNRPALLGQRLARVLDLPRAFG